MQIHSEKHQTRLHEPQLINVVNDLGHFIMHEVVNVRSKYFHNAQELAMDLKYIGHREWEKKEHSTI